MHEGVFEGIEKFRRRLSDGDTLIGSGITLADPQVTDAIAGTVDFLWIDNEHAPINPETLRGHLLAARARGTAALVRVPYLHPAFIKNALDSGAPGIIVPQIRGVEDVEKMVADCRYAPIGSRGFGPTVPSDYGRDGGRDYIERANASIFVSPQIETASAVDAIEAIVAVPGVDFIVLGPHDLASSLGHIADPEHPTVVQAIEHVISTAKKAGLFVGSGMPEDRDYCKTMAGRGVQWMQVGGDCRYMVSYADDLVAELRGVLSGGTTGS